jgi:hypothetical protein
MKGSLLNGQAVLQCSSEELYELLFDMETASSGKKFESSQRRLILDRLLALKHSAGVENTIESRALFTFDGLAELHVKGSAEIVFRTLRSLFPQDACVLDLDLAALCDWPDFAACRWQDTEVAVPFSGVMCVGGVSFVYTDEFSTFFPREICSGFNVMKAWVLPPFSNTPSNNALLSQLATAINIPSLKSSARDKCALVVVLSGLTESSLDAGIAIKLLHECSPHLPLSLARCMLDAYQQHFFPGSEFKDTIMNSGFRSSQESPSSDFVTTDNAAKQALLLALKRFLDPTMCLKRQPLLKRASRLILCCAKSVPLDVYRCGLVDLMLNMSIDTSLPHSSLLLSAITAVTSCVCVLPAIPNDPCDIIGSVAPNNWPDVINRFIPDIHHAGHKSFEGMICFFLKGRTRFNQSFGTLHQGIINSLYAAISAHFRAYNSSSSLYYNCVLRWLSTMDVHSTFACEGGDFSCVDLIVLTRILIQLLLSGKFEFRFIGPCVSFLQSCVKLQVSSEELESCFNTVGAIVNAIIPALDPRNDQPLHICLLPRAVFEVANMFRALEFLSVTADGISVDNVVSSLGWCEFGGDDNVSNARLPLISGVLLDAVKSCHNSCATVADLCAATNLSFQTVHVCVMDLVDKGFLHCETPLQSSSAVFRMVNELPPTIKTEKQYSFSAHFGQQQGPSPISPDYVEPYIDICSMILKRVISASKSSNAFPVAEAVLIASISRSEHVSASHVASAIYFLISRDILRRIVLGSASFVVLAHTPAADDFDVCCGVLAGLSASESPGVPSWKFQEHSIFQKVVVFAISDVEYPQQSAGNDSVLSRCMLLLNPSSCIHLEQKSGAEDLITRTINQLCRSTDMSFLMAAKELMNAHGYPERVLIKYMDASLYSIMFSDDVASDPQVDSAIESSNDKCFVCTDSENLFRLPCKHCMCEDCFESRFLNDKSHHVYGALPEDQTPSASAAVEDGPRPADYFSCPFCRAPLGWQFWSEFPDRLKQLQREKPEGKQVTLEHVHRKIVLNTLRVLRRDPLAALARYEPKTGSKTTGCYVACVNVQQPVTCQGSAFDSICDIKNEESQNLGLSLDQQWKALARKIDEHGRGNAAAPAGSAADESDLQPQFVPDSERPQNEAGRLMDFRMCPKCFYGNIVNTTCSSMGTHHGEQNTINGALT